MAARQSQAAELSPPVAAYVSDRIAEFDDIAADRRELLEKVATYIKRCQDERTPIRLTFICTHNSRRSQFAQVWAAVAAAHYGVEGVETFSGGSEGTAFNPRAIAALRRAGLGIDGRSSEGGGPTANRHYEVLVTREGEPLECFSKKYDQPPNPDRDFLAVMVCAEADKNCPIVPGAAERLALPYDDPKIADDTPGEAAKYDERCAQIAREMHFIFAQAARSSRQTGR